MKTLLILAILFLIQQVIDPNQILLILAPAITWLSTMAVNWVKSKLGTQGFGGTIAITMVVPAMSLIAGYLTSLIVPGINLWIGFLIALGGNFINQFIKQWAQTIQGTQDSILPNFTTVKKADKL